MRQRSAAPAASDSTSPIMGRKVFLAVFCFLMLSETPTDAKISSIKLEDSVGEATFPRLYRNLPTGIYASASPYAAFSFNIPTFASSPRLTQASPVKQGSTIVENIHGFLKDSYGNKFVGSPQTLAYRTAFPQQFVQLQELPAHLAQPLVSAAPSFQYKQVTPHFFGPPQFKLQALQTASPSTANSYAINQPYSISGSVRSLAPIQQKYPVSSKAIFENSHDNQKIPNQKNVEKSQRLEEIPNNQNKNTQSDNDQLKSIAASASATNREKAVINIVTQPPLPLLDLTLLEPLTFENPLVPQVQHFLPKISSVTYQKLPQLNVKEKEIKNEMKQFIIQNTKPYASGVIKSKPKDTPKERESRPQKEPEETSDELDPPRDIPNEEPEIIYEINSPNYKETYKEKVLSYNKETQSEPVHYSYDTKTEKKPVHYNYVRTSEQPISVKHVNYESNGENPEHLIYKFKPEEIIENKNAAKHSPQQNESENPSDDSNEDGVSLNQAHQHQGQGPEKKTSHYNGKPEHREEEYQHNPDKFVYHNNHHNSPQQYSQVKNTPVNIQHVEIQPVIKEYEEDIRILPIPKEYATIKVDPNQHIQHHGHVLVNHNSRESHDRPPHEFPRNQPQSHQRLNQPSEEHTLEKSKHAIDKLPDEDESPNNEQQDDDKDEEKFEKDYKNAAYGFPAYESSSRDSEKEIYNPDTYGMPKYHTDYDIEHTPFQQYQLEGDGYPKSTRLNYKDARDKTKEDYYLDYAISKPKSIESRYRHKEDYYKMFMKQKPQYLKSGRESDEKESAKYIAAPVFEYHSSPQKPKQYFAKYQVASHPKVYEYDYSKEAPKDNSAHATRPHQRFKTHTQFVEPQFQYGFEPSGLPRLFDSELAAMASNNSPESEKLGMRKKIYKENWYLKKINTNGRKTAS